MQNDGMVDYQKRNLGLTPSLTASTSEYNFQVQSNRQENPYLDPSELPVTEKSRNKESLLWRSGQEFFTRP